MSSSVPDIASHDSILCITTAEGSTGHSIGEQGSRYYLLFYELDPLYRHQYIFEVPWYHDSLCQYWTSHSAGVGS
eukprot:3047881-Rhodomonas_salina.4